MHTELVTKLWAILKCGVESERVLEKTHWIENIYNIWLFTLLLWYNGLTRSQWWQKPPLLLMKCDIWMQLSLIFQDGMRYYSAQRFSDGRDASMTRMLSTDACVVNSDASFGGDVPRSNSEWLIQTLICVKVKKKEGISF